MIKTRPIGTGFYLFSAIVCRKNGIYNLRIEKFLLSLHDLSYVRGCFACER